MSIQKRKNKGNPLSIVRNKAFLESVKNVFENSKNTTIIIPNLCNNSGTFSGPINNMLKENFPQAFLNYQLLTKKFLSENNGYCQIVECKKHKRLNNKIFVANMIAQDTYQAMDPKRTINYFYLIKAMYNIEIFIDKNLKDSDGELTIQIHSPKFGIGYPGGKWDFVKEIMEDVWKYHNVYVYQKLK